MHGEFLQSLLVVLISWDVTHQKRLFVTINHKVPDTAVGEGQIELLLQIERYYVFLGKFDLRISLQTGLGNIKHSLSQVHPSDRHIGLAFSKFLQNQTRATTDF